MDGIRKTLLAAIAFAAIAAIVIFSSIGETLPYAFFQPVSLNGPAAVDSDGKTTAIADSQSRRLLVLDENMELVRIVSYDAFNAPIQAITDISISNGTIYVAGVVYKNDSSLIEQEKVLTYDRNGKYLSPVYESARKTAAVQSLKSLNRAPGGMIAALVDELDSTGQDGVRFSISLIAMSAGSPAVEIKRTGVSSIFDAFDIAYSSASDLYSVLSFRGILFDEPNAETDKESDGIEDQGLVFTSIDIGSNGDIYACEDTTGSIYRVDGKTGETTELVKGSGYDEVHVCEDMLAACSIKTNRVIVAGIDGKKLHDMTAVPLSAPLAARVILTEACGVYLLVFIVVMAMRRRRRLLGHERASRLGPVFSSLAVVVAVGLAIGFAARDIYQTSYDTRADEINAYANYIDSMSDDLAASLELCKERGAFRQDGEQLDALMTDQYEIFRRVGMLADSAASSGIGIYIIVYGIDVQGAFYVYDSSNEQVLGTGSTGTETRSDIMDASSGKDGGAAGRQLHSGSTLRDTTLYRLVPVPGPNGTDVVGVVEVGSRINSFEASILNGLTRNVLMLIVIALVVYLTYSEARGCLRCLFRYRQLQEDRTKDAIAVLTRPFTFVVTLLTSIDAVMTVLIAKDLVDSAGMGEHSLLIALPAAMLGAGMAFGHGIYGRLGARVDLRRLVTCGAAAMAVCALFAVGTVAIDSFWLYCLAKLLMAIPFGLLYTFGYSLPRCAESDEVRSLAANGVTHTDVSAAALGTLLGGFIAQMLGNQWVYVLVAFVALLVLVIAASLFPKRYGPLEASDGQRRGATKLLRNPAIIALVLLVLAPAIIASGYNTFIFPLLVSDAGVPIASTSLLFVIGQIVVYASIGLTGSAYERFGKERVVIAAVGLLGVVFLLFSLNTSVVWAVVVIALVGVLRNTAEGWDGPWMRAAEKCGVPAGTSTGAMFATESVILIVQPIILGFLVGVGSATAVLVIGAACVACALLYRAISRRLE